MRLLLVLLLLGSLLSGCTAIGADGPALMTAKQAIGPAERAAQRWADDAVLVDASASELDDASRREAADEIADTREELREARDDGDISESDYDNYTELFSVYDTIVDTNDDDVGDGRASLWSFSFASETKQDAYLVAVAHGDVVYKKAASSLAMGDDGWDWEWEAEDAVGDWQVDSDDAGEAAQLNEEYKRLCGETKVSSGMYLYAGRDGPEWDVSVYSEGEGEDEFEYASLTIDAVNGSIIDETISVPGEIPIQEDILYQEAGRVGDQFVAAVATTMSATFHIADDRHLQMSLHARVQPPPVQPVTITVTSPDGVETELELQSGGPAPFVAMDDAFVEGVLPGDWQVEATAQLSLRDTWTLYYCTDGLPEDQDTISNPACEVFYDGGAAQQGGAGSPPAETLSRLGRWLGAWQS